jgi:mannitol-specific phosphotransferase system IIBC component
MEKKSIQAADVKEIIFACEAGIGSSLMGVNMLKKKLKKAGVAVKVYHKPARQLPETAQVVVVHKGMANLIRKRAPDAVVIAFTHFLNDPAFDQLVTVMKENGTIEEVG